MKFKLASLFVLAIIVLAVFTYNQLTPPFAKGDVAPEFVLNDLNDNLIQLSSFKGSPVLVHFWATWCPQCVYEIPALDDFATKYPDIKVLTVSEDEGGQDAVSAFFRDDKPSFTILLDGDGKVADKYKNYKVPETYLLDTDGKFVYRFIGAVSWADPAIYEFIQKNLGRTPKINSNIN
ncbi:MAG: hypothetical protein A3I09_01855 [Deltaproteobacteria bacterium RIFCSPLOWO2_02_FULL_47_10]|nr:MAG: hypothetical protein A3I09_01855 [Deltaproteobacteria bacterium RIFCSPLOWO2_02_FULL_47_10]